MYDNIYLFVEKIAEINSHWIENGQCGVYNEVLGMRLKFLIDRSQSIIRLAFDCDWSIWA